MTAREVHVELLIGRTARDVDGRVVGRIQEFIVEHQDGVQVVTEYHLGPAALLERLMVVSSNYSIFRNLPFRPPAPYRVSWEQMDLRDLTAPRVLVPRDQLLRGQPHRR